MKNFWLTVLALILFIGIALLALYLLRDVFLNPSTVLTSTECDPPCWNGIHPGESSFTNVSRTLGEMEGVDQQSINTSAPTTSGEVESISWLFQPPARDVSGTVYLENEIVSAISILTVNSLTLEQVFERFGEPELVWAEIAPSSYREPVELSLIYSKNGFLVEAVIDLKQGEEQVEVSEKTHVYRAVYFDPQKYQDLLETRILIRRPPPTRKNTPQPWTGFGIVQVK